MKFPPAAWPFPTGHRPDGAAPLKAWPWPTQATHGHRETPAQVLASILLRALGMREGSYDHEASDAAQADYCRKVEEANAKGDGSKLGFLGVDYNKFYRQPLTACCWVAAKEAGHEELAQAAYIMLGSWSNDSTEWAESIAKTRYGVIAYEADKFANVPQRWAKYQPKPVDEDEANDDTFALPA